MARIWVLFDSMVKQGIWHVELFLGRRLAILSNLQGANSSHQISQNKCQRSCYPLPKYLQRDSNLPILPLYFVPLYFLFHELENMPSCCIMAYELSLFSGPDNFFGLNVLKTFSV